MNKWNIKIGGTCPKGEAHLDGGDHSGDQHDIFGEGYQLEPCTKIKQGLFLREGAMLVRPPGKCQRPILPHSFQQEGSEEDCPSTTLWWISWCLSHPQAILPIHVGNLFKFSIIIDLTTA